MGEANFYYFTCLKYLKKLNIHQWRTRSWPWRQGREGTMDSRHQVGSPRERRQNQEFGRNLPLLFAHQGMRDYRLLPWLKLEGRGFEDHARPEADACRSAYEVQGFCRHR